MKQKYDYVVVGAGFSGAVVARELAESGKVVLVLDQRNHIGGNCFDRYDEYGVLIHLYGPHLFHTSSQKVYDYLSKFTEWQAYEHKVVGDIFGTIVPIPFNWNSMRKLFPMEKCERLMSLLKEKYGEGAKVPILHLMEQDEDELKELAKYIYDHIFAGYTQKQWGVTPEEMNAKVTARVPVVLSYDDRYFQDEFQYMPVGGFTPIFDGILNHVNIELKLNCKAEDFLRFEDGRVFWKDQVILNEKDDPAELIWTGPIDEFFNCQFGRLPYRTLKFKWEHYKVDSYQSGAVVNYPVSEEYTRISEFKKMTGQKIKGTTILKEFPGDYIAGDKDLGIPYYAVQNEETDVLIEKYRKEASKHKHLHFLGRLGEYRYYNMDVAILRALSLAHTLNGR